MIALLLAAALGAGPSTSGPWFAMPGPLSVDPRKISAPPLAFTPERPREVTLPNGIVVYLAVDHSVPIVSLRALVRAGSVDEPGEKVGLAALTASAMRAGGAGDLSADALDTKLDQLAIDLGVGAGGELSSASVSSRVATRKEAFALFAQVLLHPRFQADRVELQRQRFLEGVRRRKDSPAGEANRLLFKRLYGPHSVWAREPTQQTLKAISVDDLRAFHARVFLPNATRLLVSGDFEPEEVLTELRALFGDWKPGPLPPRDFPQTPRTLKRTVLLVPRPIPQAKIRIGEFGFTRHDPQQFAYELLGDALGGSSGENRLKQAIRVERGLAYSVGAGISAGTDIGVFSIGADTKPESAVALIEETLQQLEAVRSKAPISGPELSRVRDEEVNAFAFRFDTPGKRLSEWATYDALGYPADHLTRYRARLGEVTSEDIVRAAAQIVRPEQLQIVVVGDPAKLGDLSKFGPVVQVPDVETYEP